MFKVNEKPDSLPVSCFYLISGGGTGN